MPLRSSSSPADIGLSKSEYEEAVNLEKLYFLVNKNDRCANCGRGGVAGVDVSRYEFLCAGCSSGKSSFKRIGEDRFSSFEVNKLCARFDRDSSRRGSRRGQSRSPPPRANSGRTARGSRRASRRQPSPVYVESESDYDDEPSPPPPRRSHSMPRGGDSSGRYKQQRHHRQGGDPFDNLDSGGGGWGDPLMPQGGPRTAGPQSGGGGMGLISNSSPAAAGMLGVGMQQQPGLTGMFGGGGGVAAGPGIMGGGGLFQQQQPWGGGGATGAAGLQQQQLLQQQLLQQQQLLLLRQQQMAAVAAGRGIGAGMLGATNAAAGLPLGQGGAAGGMLRLSLQRPQTFSTPGNAGMVPPQQQLQSPFFMHQPPQYPLTPPNAASSNPFLSVQPQQQPGLGGSTAGAGNFASLQQCATAFPQQQHQLLQQQTGMRPLGVPAATVLGGQQASNPFTSLGAVQRSSTPTLANAGRFGGAGGAGAATGGGNVYNSSLW